MGNPKQTDNKSWETKKEPKKIIHPIAPKGPLPPEQKPIPSKLTPTSPPPIAPPPSLLPPMKPPAPPPIVHTGNPTQTTDNKPKAPQRTVHPIAPNGPLPPEEKPPPRPILPPIQPPVRSTRKARPPLVFTTLEAPCAAVQDAIRKRFDEDTKLVRHPHENDVLCGRGGRTNNHLGNMWFRDLINCNRALYRQAKKIQKSMISKAIIATIRQQNPPGRFLEEREDKFWHPISYDRALVKTSQALRDRNHPDNREILPLDKNAEITRNPVEEAAVAVMPQTIPPTMRLPAPAFLQQQLHHHGGGVVQEPPKKPPPAPPKLNNVVPIDPKKTDAASTTQTNEGSAAAASSKETKTPPKQPSSSPPSVAATTGGTPKPPAADGTTPSATTSQGSKQQLPPPVLSAAPTVLSSGPIPMGAPAAAAAAGAMRATPPWPPGVLPIFMPQHPPHARFAAPHMPPPPPGFPLMMQPPHPALQPGQMPPPHSLMMHPPPPPHRRYAEALEGIDRALQRAELSLQQVRKATTTAMAEAELQQNSSERMLNKGDGDDKDDDKKKKKKKALPLDQQGVDCSEFMVNLNSLVLSPQLPSVEDTIGRVLYEKIHSTTSDQAILIPGDQDVLCGRGGVSNNHIGNHVYRELVKCNRPLYNSSRKYQKLQISKAVVAAILSQNPPGRFLEATPDRRWHCIEYDRAVGKTSQALRQISKDEQQTGVDTLTTDLRNYVRNTVRHLWSKIVAIPKRRGLEIEAPIRKKARNERTAEDDASDVLNLFGSIAWQLQPS